MRTRSGTPLLLAAGLVLIMFTLACGIVDLDDDDNVRNTDFEVTEPFLFELEVKQHTRLRLEAVNGVIEIAGESGATSVTISGERRVGSESQSDAEAHLDDLEVRVADLGGEVLVETKQPSDSQGRNYVVDFTITLPIDFEVLVDHVNGGIHVDSLHNRVSVNNVNGEIILDDIAGSCDVDLVNGQIDGEVTLPEDGTLDLSTVNGNVALAVPTTTSAVLSARVTNGNIAVSNLVLENVVRTNTSLQATLGDQKGTISLRTVNGNINLRGF